MRGRWLAAIAVALVAPCEAAQEASPSFDSAGRWGTAWLLTEPAYPKNALEKGLTGYVDVEARVTGTGELKEIEFKPGAPEAEAFVDALREPAKIWRFYGPIGDDCLPSSERISSRVWFEIDAGKPRIFVSRGEHRMFYGPHLTPMKRVEPNYPRRMIRDNREAILFARSEIDPSGKVIGVTATAFPRERAELLFEFEKETRRALALWVFPPAPEGATASRFFCSDVFYRLRG
jgi:hypothetical protein